VSSRCATTINDQYHPYTNYQKHQLVESELDPVWRSMTSLGPEAYDKQATDVNALYEVRKNTYDEYETKILPKRLAYCGVISSLGRAKTNQMLPCDNALVGPKELTKQAFTCIVTKVVVVQRCLG
jgi:hypothetical protein